MNGNVNINFNGQQVALKFGFPQAKDWGMSLADDMINSATKKGLFFEGDNLSTWGYAHLVYSAYKNACMVRQEKPVITFEQIVDWVDANVDSDDFQKEIQEVVNVWEESRYTKSWANQLKKNVKEMENLTKPTPKRSSSKLKRPSSQGDVEG